MARMRNIKHSFFTNEKLADCSKAARLLFAGLWTIADREGRLEDRPRKIKAELFPYDDDDVIPLLTELEEAGFISRYTVGQDRFIQVVNFSRHQRPHPNEAPSLIPTMPETDEPELTLVKPEAEIAHENQPLTEAPENSRATHEVSRVTHEPLMNSSDPCGEWDVGNENSENGNKNISNNRAREPDREHWAVGMYFEKFGVKPHDGGLALIETVVTDREIWNAVLQLWKGNNHQASYIGNLVDRYQREVKKREKGNRNGTIQQKGGASIKAGKYANRGR